MKSNLLKKGLISSLMLVLLVLPIGAYADELEREERPEEVRRFSDTRDSERFNKGERKEFMNPFRDETRDKESRVTNKLDLVKEYTPEDYDTWVQLIENKELLKAENKSIKAEIKEISKEKISEARDKVKRYKLELEEQIDDGDLTREEAADLFDRYIESIKLEMEEYKEIKEQFKNISEKNREYSKELFENKKEINEFIRNALESGETELIPEHLKLLLDINLELEANFQRMNNDLLEILNNI